MKKLILIFAVLFSLLSCGQVPGIGGMISVVHNQTVSYCNDTIYYNASPATTMTSRNSNLFNYGQTFVSTGDVSSLRVRLTMAGSPNFNIRAKIYQGSVVGQDIDAISNTLLATSTNVVAASTIVNNTDYEFNFTESGVTGTMSVIFVYENVITHSSGNNVFFGASLTSVYSGGISMYCMNNGLFTAYSTRDLGITFIYVCE